jgi:hypothetical protein
MEKKGWYEYVLVAGVFVQKGQTPEDVFLDIENGSVLLDMDVIGNNDDPVTQDTWMFDEFKFITPGVYAPGCDAGMLEYEFGNMHIDVFAPHYNGIVQLFRQYEDNIRKEPKYCAASVITRWRCITMSYYHYETGMEWDNEWELVGELVLPRGHQD